MVSVRYLSANGYYWIGAILLGTSALLFFVSYSFFHCVTLKLCPLFPVSLFLVYFLFFIFLGVWSVLLVKIVRAFPWITVRSSDLSIKIYGSDCRWFCVTWRKSFYCAQDFRAVTSKVTESSLLLSAWWGHRWWIEILVNGPSLMLSPCASRCSLLCLSRMFICA